MKFEKLGNILSIEKGKKHVVVDSPTSDSFRVLQIDDLRSEKNIKFTNDSVGVAVTEDDIMIAWDGANAGTIGFGKKGFIGSTIAALRNKNPNKYFTEYLGRYLQTQFNYLQRTATGATIPHINRNALEALDIPIPKTLPDQIKIAKILAKVEELIKQRNENIDLLDDFLKSTFLKMFGKINHSKSSNYFLQDIATKINDGEHGSVKKTDNGYLYLMARNITQDNEISFDEVSYVSEKAHKKMYKRCNPEKGDILLVCVGATIGKVAIVPSMEEFSIARSIALIKPDFRKITSQYLLGFFNSNYAKAQIKNSSNTAAQAGLYINKIKEIQIPVPPLPIQNEYSVIFDKVEQLKVTLKNHLNDLKDLYGSLSQRAFKGELDLESLVIDHIIPVSKGGSDDALNLDVTNKKLNKTVEDSKRVENSGDLYDIDKATAKRRSKKFYQEWKELQRKKSKSKLTWDKVSSEQVANWIKDSYNDFHFTSELIIRFLKDEHVTFPDYYSSEELKKNPKLNDADDLKTFIFSALNNENPFLKLEQVFYDAEEDNIDLTLRDEDFELIKDRSKEERSGIYLRIAE